MGTTIVACLFHDNRCLSRTSAIPAYTACGVAASSS
jgi:hypothetical protein